MKSFRKTFAFLPFRLLVFVAILAGMCLRGGERAGVIASPNKKKTLQSAPSSTADHSTSLTDDLKENKNSAESDHRVSAQQSSSITPSNLSPSLVLSEEKRGDHVVPGSSPADLFKKASGSPTVHK